MSQSNNKKEKFIVIDGNGLAYRAFYALPPLKTSRGEPVNAVYGVTNMLLKILEREEPDYIAVAFDKSRPTVRLEQFDEYKAHRQKMPEELLMQFPIIEKVVKVFNISTFSMEGYEADDCIGTLAHSAKQKGFFTKIYSGDLDMLQLVDQNTRVVTTRRGISDLVVYDPEMVRKRYGINPPQLVDYKSLAGDSSDHIPGIPGIGEASASKLLNQFENLEEMYENPEKIPSRWRKQILENRDQAFLSKRLVSLEKELDLGFKWEDLKHTAPNRDAMKRLFVGLEFKTLLKKMGFSEEDMNEIQEIMVSIVGKDEDLDAMRAKLKAVDSFSIFWVADEDMNMVGMAIGHGESNGYYFPVQLPEQLNISSTFGVSTFSHERIIHELKPLFENNSIIKFVFNLKDGAKFLKRGEYFSGKNFIDLKTATYMLDPDVKIKNMEDLMSIYSDSTPKTLEEILSIQKGKKKLKVLEIPLQDLVLFIAGRAVRLSNMGPEIIEKIKKKEMFDPYLKDEMALTPVISALETRGIRVNRDTLQKEEEEYQREIDSISNEIYELAGHEFKINSTRQLGKILFEELKLPGARRTASGYKTGAEILEKIIDEHPIVQKVLDYREKTKAKQQNIDSIKEQINKNDGKIHPQYEQNGTILGKIKLVSPRLNKLPENLREIFIPSDEERVFIKFAFFQLDILMLAHLAGEEELLEVFRNNLDAYEFIASRVFDIKPEEVTGQAANEIKEIVSGLLNGDSTHNISQKIGHNRTETKKIIGNFEKKFPKIMEYREKINEEAREKGTIKTIKGRIREIPNINSRNRGMKTQAEKNAFTYAVRGSSIDVIKTMILQTFDKVLQGHRDIHLILQYGHEFLFETKKRRAEKYTAQVLEIIDNIFKLKAPIKVEAYQGDNWLEMEKIDKSKLPTPALKK